MEEDFTEERDDLVRKKRDLQKEVDFLSHEQNQRELELVEVKERLRKREEELKEIKGSLNTQLQSVNNEYLGQVETLTQENEKLKEEAAHNRELYQDESK